MQVVSHQHLRSQFKELIIYANRPFTSSTTIGTDMRASLSLTSIFSSLLSPAYGGSFLLQIPSIQVIKAPELPSDASPASLPRRIRRWRGALGTMGDYTLQLPSQGPTSAARLALARQGCATGSYRLNCSESLYVVDQCGRAMFERIQLEEELEAGLHGLMEKPPMRGSNSTTETTTTSGPPLASVSQVSGVALPKASSGAAMLTRKMTTRRVATYGGEVPRRRPSARPRKPIPSSLDMRFSSQGLSSCATFTEGLCELDEFDDLAVAPYDKSSARLSASFSAHELGVTQPVLESITWNLTWLSTSLKKHSYPYGPRSKKDTSKSSLCKSFTAYDLASLYVEGPVAIEHEAPESPILKPASKRRKVQKRHPREKELVDSIRSSSSTGLLPRTGSWSRLRRKFANQDHDSLSSQDAAVREGNPGSPLRRSISVSAALLFMTQRGISVTGCTGLEYGELLVDLPA